METKPTELDVENSIKIIEDYYKGKVINANYDVLYIDKAKCSTCVHIVIDEDHKIEVWFRHSLKNIDLFNWSSNDIVLNKTVTLKLSFSESEKKQAYDNFMLKHNS